MLASSCPIIQTWVMNCYNKCQIMLMQSDGKELTIYASYAHF
uniref:Uncharacterized protein n=1 Tax=Anguilla anguilla TaxID=7936 RepID=A0A0E9QFE4_ANGAN